MKRVTEYDRHEQYKKNSQLRQEKYQTARCTKQRKYIGQCSSTRVLFYLLTFANNSPYSFNRREFFAGKMLTMKVAEEAQREQSAAGASVRPRLRKLLPHKCDSSNTEKQTNNIRGVKKSTNLCRWAPLSYGCPTVHHIDIVSKTQYASASFM